MIRKITITAISIAISLYLSYLSVAYFKWECNIGKWSEATRLSIIAPFVAFMYILNGYYFLYLQDSEKDEN